MVKVFAMYATTKQTLILSSKPKQNANKPKIQRQPWLPFQSDCTSPSLWGRCRPSVTWPGPARSGRSASGCGAWCGWWGCPTWSRTALGRRWPGRWTAQTPGLHTPLAPTGKKVTGIRPTNLIAGTTARVPPWGPFWTEVAVGGRAETAVVAVVPAVVVAEVTSPRPTNLIISRCYWTSSLSRTILNWSNSRKRSRMSSGRSSGSSSSSNSSSSRCHQYQADEFDNQQALLCKFCPTPNCTIVTLSSSSSSSNSSSSNSTSHQ